MINMIIKFLNGEKREFESLAGADLTGANLYRADLTGADLYGANLYGANLRNAKLDFQIVCLQSSRYDIVLYDWDNLKIGCQLHSLDEWLERGAIIAVKCGETDHYKAEIAPIIKMFEVLREQKG